MKKSQFCPKGHDTFVIGRYKNGACIKCDKDRHRKDLTKDSRIKEVCKNGHNISICGRDTTGHCKECILNTDRSDYNREYYRHTLEHQLARAKEYRDTHRDQIKEYQQEYDATHKDDARERHKENYDPQKAHERYVANKDLFNLRSVEWRKNNPELVKAYKIKNVTNRNLRVPQWADWNVIEEVYKNCPVKFDVDHIIPLLGKKVSGLHVSWNLQYLSHNENSSKQNKCNLLEASEWYGKILEEAGLK